MRDDLLDAQACVDWAVSNLPALEKRCAAWLDANLTLEIEDPDPNVPNNVVVAVAKEPLPRSLNVEVGAYLNVLRSALDILATALAYRFAMPRPDKAYFPVVESAAKFAASDYKGHEFVKGLPDRERGIIEDLKPYKTGNRPLWALHQLDIMRKHKKLAAAMIHPGRFSIMGWGKIEDYFTMIATGWIAVQNKTVLGLLAKDAPKPNFKFTGYISFDETALIGRMPVVQALHQFASMVEAIIKSFDGP
jgi:hypothetical protein